MAFGRLSGGQHTPTGSGNNIIPVNTLFQGMLLTFCGNSDPVSRCCGWVSDWRTFHFKVEMNIRPEAPLDFRILDLCWFPWLYKAFRAPGDSHRVPGFLKQKEGMFRARLFGFVPFELMLGSQGSIIRSRGRLSYNCSFVCSSYWWHDRKCEGASASIDSTGKELPWLT